MNRAQRRALPPELRRVPVMTITPENAAHHFPQACNGAIVTIKGAGRDPAGKLVLRGCEPGKEIPIRLEIRK